MFERYTEKARRVVFFARYEANQLGSRYLEPEHLLLAVIREDKKLLHQFLSARGASEDIREQIEARATKREEISTSVDMPMSADAKRVLAYAEEEAATSPEISTAHLLLGILRLETGLAVEILHDYGLSLVTVREELHGAAPSGSVKPAHSKPTACRDCKHLVVDERMAAIARMSLFCGASPLEPEFDCFTGERKSDPSASPSERYQLCAMINFGDCRLFEPKREE